VWGIGVYGAGYTNGGTRSAGIMGDGEVNASADTGSAIGVRGYATATHSGGLNIGILGDASGSSTGNYGLYTNMASGSTLFANYHAGTAVSIFGGNIYIGALNSPYATLQTYSGTTSPSLTVGTAASAIWSSSVGTELALTTSGSSPYLLALQGRNNNYGGPSGVSYPIGLNPLGGNVLIGTTTDSGYKLDVNGTGRFTGLEVPVYVASGPIPA
jgi:hypothetical protein